VHLVGSHERGSLFFDRLATSPDEGLEESVAQIIVHLFRVPLYADLPSRSHLELFSANTLYHFDHTLYHFDHTLYRFDHAIFCPGDDAEQGARCADRLMVQAVDVPSTCFEDRSQKALGVDVDGVSPGCWQAMFSQGRIMAWEMGLELAAARLNHELHPVTNPENRDSSVLGGSVERHIEAKLIGGDEIEFNSRGQWSIAGEIVPPRQDEAVQPLHERDGVALNRKVERLSPGSVDGVGVAPVDVVVLAPLAPSSLVVEAEGNPDSRRMHGTSIAIWGMLPEWHRW
jgi:hypothetical protein